MRLKAGLWGRVVDLTCTMPLAGRRITHWDILRRLRCCCVAMTALGLLTKTNLSQFVVTFVCACA